MDDIPQISEEVYKLLSDANWDVLGKKMLSRAIWRGQTRYGINALTVFGSGHTLEDVVSEVIVSTFLGRRKWHPSKIELEKWLENQIDSVIDWWINLIENNDSGFVEIDNVSQDEILNISRNKANELEIALKYGAPNPENILLQDVDEISAKKIVDELYDSFSDDPKIQEILLVMLDLDEIKQRNISKEANIPINEVQNHVKKIKRRLQKIIYAQERAENEKKIC